MVGCGDDSTDPGVTVIGNGMNGNSPDTQSYEDTMEMGDSGLLADMVSTPDVSEGTDTGSEDIALDAGNGDSVDISSQDVSVDASAWVDTSTPDTSTPDTTQTPPDNPMEAGPYPVSTQSASIDAGGGVFGSSISMDLYLPSPQGPFPVVVFTHGFSLSPGDYASYGEHLASWGYVAVLPQMPGSFAIPSTHVELKEHLSSILDWVEGSPGELGGKADASLIALAGHSMGGKVSLLLATEDSRPKAICGVDPVDSGPPISFNPQDYPSVTPELMDQITVPLLLLGETTDASGAGQACAPADNNFQQYYLAAVSPTLMVEFLGANHMSFLDNPNCGVTCNFCNPGSDDTAMTRKRAQGLMVAFFNQRLLGDDGAAYWLTGDGMAGAVSDGLVVWESKNAFE